VATISFSEERVRLREGLLRLVDAGVSVRAAAESLGVSTGSAYWMLRGAGQLAGMRRVITDAHRARVVEVSDASGSVNRAASVSKLGYPVARRILVEAGRVSAQPRPRGKAAARARFLELVGQGWSSARAARGRCQRTDGAGLAQWRAQGQQHADLSQRRGRGLAVCNPLHHGHETAGASTDQ
jgi:molybdenum-dependent DNA-binding transcriptional regulator ModE